MTKRLTHELSYDAPLDLVHAMLADPAFREEVCDYQRVLRRTVVIEGDAAAGGMDVTIDPRYSWTSVERAKIHVTIPGKPG